MLAPKMGRSEFRKELGLRIRTARLRRGWSQAELGARGGTTRNQIERYERGACGMPADRLFSLCDALQVNPVYLFGINWRHKHEVQLAGSHALKLAMKLEELPYTLRMPLYQVLNEICRNHGGNDNGGLPRSQETS